MSSQLPSWRLTQLQGWLDTKLAQLDLANTSYSELLTKKAQEYRLDTTEGMQRVMRVRLGELKKQISELEGDIEDLQDRIRNIHGLTNMNLRRNWA
jgi:TolA-binding protein